MSEATDALRQLGITIWVPVKQDATAISDETLSATYQVIFPGKDPLIAVWVDVWDENNRQTLAKILRFIHIPLSRCAIIGPGQESDLMAVKAVLCSIGKLLAFGAPPKKLVDSLGTIEYVESIPLAQVISDPSLKKQVLHELWEHRLPTD